MAYKTEKTVPKISVGADKEQPSQKCTVNIITESSANFNGFGKRNGYTHRSISNIGRVQVFFFEKPLRLVCRLGQCFCRLMSAEAATGVPYPSESPRHLYSRSAESVIMGYTL